MQWRIRPAVRYVIGSASHSLLMCRYGLGEEPSSCVAEEAPTPDVSWDHAPYDADDVTDYNEDAEYCPENILSLLPGCRNGEGPPTLVFPNLGPLPIVGFAPHPPPPAGPPLTLPLHPDVRTDAGANLDAATGPPDGENTPGVYVNGLWIPKSELFQQFGGRSPPCLVYHPIPWIRIRSSSGHSRGIVPSDAHYRLFFSRRPLGPTPQHRGSWSSTRRPHESQSPYRWCLSPPPQPPPPHDFPEDLPLQQQQQHSEEPLIAAPSDGQDAQSPLRQASPYVYPGYSFGPPVFTAPVLPVQASAGKSVRPTTPPVVTLQRDPLPPVVTSEETSPLAPPTALSPKKKKKKRKSRSRDTMERASDDTACPVPTGDVATLDRSASHVSSCPIGGQAPAAILHFVEALLRSTLGEASQQISQIRYERLLNGYAEEVLGNVRHGTMIVNPKAVPTATDNLTIGPVSIVTDLSVKVTKGSSNHGNVRHSDYQGIPEVTGDVTSITLDNPASLPAVTPTNQPVSIVFTIDSGNDRDLIESATVEGFSEKVAESILRDLTPNNAVHASRSQLFLEGLENSYPGSAPEHIEQYSAQFVEVVFREVYQKLGKITSNVIQHSLDTEMFFEVFAEELLQSVFRSAREEFSVNQLLQIKNDLSTSQDLLPQSCNEKPSALITNELTEALPEKTSIAPPTEESPTEETNPIPESKTSKPLVHFLEQGFHAPSSETFGDVDFQDESLEDYVSRERYMEGDPALSHLSILNQDTLLTDNEHELSELQNRVMLTNHSIYKLSYDEISYTDQSESEDLEPAQNQPNRVFEPRQTDQSTGEDWKPVQHQPMRILDSYHHLRTEIPVYEAETASEAGSEDIELIPHRYESSTTPQEKHLYVNRLSLATELLHTNENLPYDDDFKRIIDEEGKVVDEGTVNLGFVLDESKVITSRPKAICRISAADSGVQSEESEEEVDVERKSKVNQEAQKVEGDDDQDEEEVWSKTTPATNQSTAGRKPQPNFLPPGAPVPPWCSLCCNVQ